MTHSLQNGAQLHSRKALLFLPQNRLGTFRNRKKYDTDKK
jgi:hypothetical protein